MNQQYYKRDIESLARAAVDYFYENQYGGDDSITGDELEYKEISEEYPTIKYYWNKDNIIQPEVKLKALFKCALAKNLKETGGIIPDWFVPLPHYPEIHADGEYLRQSIVRRKRVKKEVVEEIDNTLSFEDKNAMCSALNNYVKSCPGLRWEYIENGSYVVGNTFPHKNKLRELGCKWAGKSRDIKGWYFSL